MLEVNPHLQGTDSMPNQMVSKSKKTEKWKKRTMDFLEKEGLTQISLNQRYYENYRLVNGEFIEQYFNEEGSNFDPILQFTKKFDLPKHIRHYDILSQPFNSLVGEFITLPETAYVKAQGDDVLASKERAKKRIIQEFVMELINKDIEAELVRRGYEDPNIIQFNSEEERQAYLQELEAQKQQLFPQEYKNFDATWSHIAEKWANIQLKNNILEHNLRRLNENDFKHSLITAKCFRHFRITPNGRTEESWHPLSVFYSKGFNVEYPEDGSYIGRGAPMSTEDIINTFGFQLTEKQIQSLESYASKVDLKGTTDGFGNPVNYTSIDGTPYNVLLPYLNPAFDSLPTVGHSTAGYNLSNFFQPSEEVGTIFSKRYWVTEVYWFAQTRIGKVHYVDPETGQLVKRFVDEDFIVPEGFEEIKTSFNDSDYEDTPNIVIWTITNELWEGKKISGVTAEGGVTGPIYFGIQRSPFQVKASGKIWDKKLPVVGLVYDNTTVVPQSFIDKAKPFQIFYNVIMNHAYTVFENQIMPFIVMDPNLIPNTKDWGGRSTEKWLEIGQALGVTVADSNPQVTQGAPVNGGTFPRIVDVNTTPQLIAYLQLAAAVKSLALEQIGFSPQRLGDVGRSESATGVQGAVQGSYNQTSSYFSAFEDYKRRCHQMGLNFDQYVQSANDELTVQGIHSDVSNQFLKLNGVDLLLADLHVYIDNARNEADKLRIMKQFMLENNTILTSLKSRIDVLNADTSTVIMQAAIVADEELRAQNERNMKLQEQQLQMQQDQFDQAQGREQANFEAKLENDLMIAYLRALPSQSSTSEEGFKQSLAFADLRMKERMNEQSIDLQRRKLENDKQNQNQNQARLNNQERIALEREKTDRFTQLELTYRQILKNKANQKAKNANKK